MRLRYRLYALSVCLVLASCLSTVKGEKHKHFWDGRKDFEKRQTLEAYKRDTLPAIERFQTQLSQAGAGVFKRDGEVSDRSCGKNKSGREYWNTGGRGKPIDINLVIKYGKEILIPAGFTVKKERKYENGDVTIFWLNPEDGGYVYTIVKPNIHTGIYYISGCRPTDGSTTPPAQSDSD